MNLRIENLKYSNGKILLSKWGEKLNKETLKKLCTMCLIFAVTLLSLQMNFRNVLGADELVKVEVIPKTVGPIALNATIFVNVTVADVTLLNGWQIYLDFNSSILECIGATLPSDNVFSEWGSENIIIPDIGDDYINNIEGWISWAAILFPYGVGFNGSGVLCQIEFKGLAEGNATLALLSEDEHVYGTFLSRVKGIGSEYIPSEEVDLADGNVWVIPEFPAFVIIPLLMAATSIALILSRKHLTKQ